MTNSRPTGRPAASRLLVALTASVATAAAWAGSAGAALPGSDAGAALAAMAGPAAGNPGTGRPRPRIGLVLGGGGAKGAAHVGVLRVLDELRIPIDCVAGTSMGALVGGTFAAGRSATELEQAVRAISWQDTIAFQGQRVKEPMRRKLAGVTHSNGLEFGLRDGSVTAPPSLINSQHVDQTIEYLVARSRGTTDFDSLPIPFRAVATDMQKGEMVVLSHGDLAKAMRASMSVPGAFAPVTLDGRLLGDGGLTRNLPVDIARETCADVVIAVSVPNPTPTMEEMQSPLTMASRTLDILIGANERQQVGTLGSADVLITVPMGEIGSASFDKVNDAIPLGRAAALEQRAALERYSVGESEYLAWRAGVSRQPPGPVRLAAVEIEGAGRVNPEYVRATLRLQPGDVVTEPVIAARVKDVFALDDFEAVEYSLDGEADNPTLRVRLREKATGPNQLRFDVGLYMGTDAVTAFTLGGDLLRTWVNERGGEVHGSLVLGRTSAVNFSLYQPLDVRHRWFVEPGLVAQRSFEEVYSGGDAVARYRFDEAFGFLDAGRVFGTKAELRAGLRAGGQAAQRDIALHVVPEIDWEGYGGLSLRYTYDDRDAAVLARTGLLARLDFFDSQDWLGAAADYRRLEAMLSYAMPVGSNVAYVRAAGGSSLDTELPAYDAFVLGGPISFPGLGIGELRGQGYWAASASYLHKIADISDLFGKALYLGGILSAGRMEEQFAYPGVGNLYSAGVMLGGRTPLGPLTLLVAATSEGNWQLSLGLGRPIVEHTIFDPAW